MTFEFGSDGTLTASMKAGDRERTMTGSYKWESSNTLSVTMKRERPDGQTKEETGTLTVDSLDANSLTMTKGSQPQTFTRVKD